MKKILFLILLPVVIFGGGLVTGQKIKFVPGDRVLFSEDFSKCPVGEIPVSFDKIDGAGECVKYNNKIWFAPTSTSAFAIYKKLNLEKDEFSLEFTIFTNNYRDVKYDFNLLTLDPEKQELKNEKTLSFYFEPMGCHITLGKTGKLRDTPACHKQKIHIAIQVRRHQLRVFQNGKRIASIPFNPKADIAGFAWKRRHIFSLAPKEYDVLITAIKAAKYSHKEQAPKPEKVGVSVQKIEGGEKLTVPEKVLFDFNKFILKPQAKETLKVVAAYIVHNNPKKIVVTGYTDNIGSDKYNLKLSLQRAQSVADYLIYCANLDASKIEMKGLGKANPIAPNDTKENQAKNRRVEIKLMQ